MSIFMSRDGGISVFRVGITVAVLGVLLGVAAVVFAMVDQAQRQSPFNVRPFEGAVEVRTTPRSDNAREIIYQISGVAAEDVANHYQRRLDDHTDSGPNDPSRELCVRNPFTGIFPDYQEGAGNVPYYYRCVFDNSLAGGLFTSGAIQFTTITIQPGIRNDQTGLDTTGNTMVQVEQVWSG